MGYRGKVEERQRARELRAQSWTLQEIAAELGVSWESCRSATWRCMRSRCTRAKESKRDGSIVFANSDPVLMRIFIGWLRDEFDPDESKFRVRLYLHADLDVGVAIDFWSHMLDIPSGQFNKPYRAVVDETMRLNRHVHGCASIVYHSRLLHRRVMARIAAIGSALANPG